LEYCRDIGCALVNSPFFQGLAQFCAGGESDAIWQKIFKKGQKKLLTFKHSLLSSDNNLKKGAETTDRMDTTDFSSQKWDN
jgi:hypothetical protein